MNWITVQERLPKDGEWVIACSNKGKQQIARYKWDAYDHFYPIESSERQRFTRKNFSAEAEANNGLLLFPNTYKNVQQINSKPYTVDAEPIIVRSYRKKENCRKHQQTHSRQKVRIRNE